jgi:hypothetical protein
MTSPTPGGRLRRLLAAGGLIAAPGVYDGLTAALVARTGFTAAYLTGAGVSVAGFGLPDIGLVTATEMASRARIVCAALGEIPLIADADTGYGGPINVVRTVRAYEHTGVAAIQLEDQAFPKKCGHLPDKELVPAAVFDRSLRSAARCPTSPPARRACSSWWGCASGPRSVSGTANSGGVPVGMTMTEKILARKAGLDWVAAGQTVVCDVDMTVMVDLQFATMWVPPCASTTRRRSRSSWTTRCPPRR